MRILRLAQTLIQFVRTKSSDMETTEIKNTTGDPQLTPAPIAELKELDVFVGKWHAEGTAYGKEQTKEVPAENNDKWTSEESYEWLPGGFFLLHKWEARVGAQEFTGIEIIGYDAERKEYFTKMFDNGGNHPGYTVSTEKDEWKFTEEATRATATVSVDGSTITWKWEQKNNGGDWTPLCDRVATRIRSAI